jgi:hypothetical protein
MDLEYHLIEIMVIILFCKLTMMRLTGKTV